MTVVTENCAASFLLKEFFLRSGPWTAARTETRGERHFAVHLVQRRQSGRGQNRRTADLTTRRAHADARRIAGGREREEADEVKRTIHAGGAEEVSARFAMRLNQIAPLPSARAPLNVGASLLQTPQRTPISCASSAPAGASCRTLIDVIFVGQPLPLQNHTYE